jgi:hypothetical protein
MHKAYFANKQTLNLKEVPADISTWNFNKKQNWN